MVKRPRVSVSAAATGSPLTSQAHVAPEADGAAPLHGVVHDGARVALFSRTLDEITESFPDLVHPLAALAGGLGAGEAAGLILDGEIVPVDGERILPFQQLQKRLGRKTGRGFYDYAPK